MCNFSKLGRSVARAMHQYGNTVHDCLPVQTKIVPPELVSQGVCPFSGQALSHSEMHPTGAATPRHTKQHVYEAFITPADDTKCGMCGCGLDMDTVSRFRVNRREIENRFCPECRDYFALMAAVVHGDQLAASVMGANVPDNRQRQIAYEPQQTVGDVIDLVPVRHALPIKVR